MKFQIELKSDEFTKLREIAEAERRDWRAQASFILAQVLKAKGKQTEEGRDEQRTTSA